MVQLKIDPAFRSHELLQQLATYGLQESSSSDYFLSLSKEKNWVITDLAGRKLEIDFDHNRRDYDRSHKGFAELLARALGAKDSVSSVLDLTSGLGIDAVFLSQLGFNVMSIERNPLLAFLLKEAQIKSTRDEVKKIEFHLADAQDFLAQFKVEGAMSCYFDPMFPEKRKSALPRQEMLVFRNLVGEDLDATKTLESALSLPFSRVVVKRPLRAPVLIAKPAFQLSSKLLRYDVYYPESKKDGKKL